MHDQCEIIKIVCKLIKHVKIQLIIPLLRKESTAHGSCKNQAD